MIVSWNWLRDYVALDVEPVEFERRLMMAGLNHESTSPLGNDLAIDLEVTSNRPDCLGHLGIAREAAVLLGRPLKLPPAAPRESRTPVAQLTQVAITAPALCYRYVARVILGVKIGPSPAWLCDRLKTLGIPAINNVVDVTNYVLMECGQPLHAFDLDKLAGRQIIVREGRPGETLVAIDHKTYEVGLGVCVIADRDRPVAIGGVMGGAETEVAEATTNLLMESAEFDPASIRATARRLNLHSDSSYRFERGLDPQGVDWASRRACELILELAGGELAAGSIDVGRRPPEPPTIVLRLAQLKRILGIEIPPPRVREILKALGNRELAADTQSVKVEPPSWRSDLTREIDLVEEVARIHGYDAIPEDVSVPMATSARSAEDRVLGQVRHVLTAAGFDESLTVSVVEEDWSRAFSPWTSAEPLVSLTPVLRRADRLRRSLVPSLLGVRKTNESLANPVIELFEIARVYLPRAGQLPEEVLMLALTSGSDFYGVKGVVESLLAELKCVGELELRPTDHPLLDRQRSVELRLGGHTLGFLGEVSGQGLKQFDLRARTTVAELRLSGLFDTAQLVPQYTKLPVYPAVTRDMNLEMPDEVPWADVARVVRTHGGTRLESLVYRDTYRDPQRVGAGKKRVLLTITLRDPDATLTNAEADALRDRIAAACQTELGAQLQVS
jgi:phenylalanyl-tRNA synthetase beta chain